MAHDDAAAPQITNGVIQITSVVLPASTADATPSSVTFQLWGPDCGPPLPNSPAPTPSSTCAAMDLQNTPTQVDANGNPVAPFVFTVAKLEAAPSAGENATWVPYLVANGLPIAEQTYTPSTTNPVGTLVHSATGTYTYTFKTAFGSLANYDPTVLQRVGIQTHNQIFANGTYDLTPSTTPGGAGTHVTAICGSPATPPCSPDVVSTAACNQCHKLLKEHGNWRLLTEYCVTCHNPTLVLNGTPGTLAVLAHEFHGANQIAAQTTLVNNYPNYTFNGVVAADITYPQNVAHCDTCHQNLYTTPSSALPAWYSNPSYTACFTCHAVSSHPFAVTATTNCSSCHVPTNTDKTNIQIAHSEADALQGGGIGPYLKTQASGWLYQILSVTNTAPGQKPVVKLAVLGQPGCPLTPPATIAAPSTTCNISAANGPFSATGGGRLAVDIGYLISGDVQNLGDGQTFGQPISINVLTAGVVNTADFSVIVTSPTTVPAISGSVLVGIEGEAGVLNTLLNPATTVPDRVPIASTVLAYAIGSNPGSGALAGASGARRVVVDVAKCNLCHEYLTLHGNNRTPTQPSTALPYGDVSLCTMCHNPEATDGLQRPATGFNSTWQTPIDFKVMIHAIHSASTTVWSFGGSPTSFFDVTYPAPLSDCQACHITPPTGTFPETYTYSQPLVTANGSTTFTQNVDLAGHTDNLRTTKWTAVCLGCHQSANVFDSSSSPDATKVFLDHMIENGAGFSLTQPQINALNTP